ncbi:MAG: UDP-N-acetylmuramate--L-alanine ligase [Acidobacteriota bacterium]
MKLGKVRRVHFIGIGGSGMSGIDEVLLNLGYKISGSDQAPSDSTRRLTRLGARVRIGHEAAAVGGADVVVVSSAVAADNPERVEAQRQRIPVIPRAEMLGELMRLKYGVAVAGSHGKTSTTSMIATLLSRCGLDPTAVIGGRLGVLGSNAKLGSGHLMIAEADESDGSFLKLYPSLAIVTGVDHEHLENFGGKYETLLEAFLRFLGRVPFYGAVVACADDAGVQRLLPQVPRRILTYGLQPGADYTAVEIQPDGFSVGYTLQRSGEAITRVRLMTPGRHQVQNSLAALAVADELGLSLRVAAAALEEFHGADRRMQRKGESRGVLVVDDYGHHPREIAATLLALREAVGSRRIVVLFQPHRFTRLAALMRDFAACFERADALVLSDVYAAHEAPIPGVDAATLASMVRQHGPANVVHAGSLEQATQHLIQILERGDVALTLGAGSVGKTGDTILAALGRMKEPA